MSDRNALALELAGTPALSRRDALAEELAARVPMMAPDAPRPPSDLTLDIVKDSPDTAPAPEGAFARYTGKPDLPLEEAQSPLDLAIDAYTLGKGASIAQYAARNTPRLVQRGAQGLGLEVAHKVQQAVGNRPGQVTDFGWPDVLNLALPTVLDAPGLARGALPYTRAGRSVQTAADATAAQEADYAASLAEAEAAHAETVAAARAQRDPMRSTWGVTDPPVPQRLESLRSSAPMPVEPRKITMPGPGRLLSEIGGGGFLSQALGTMMPQKIATGIALADTTEALISKALMSPTVRPWFLRQLEANGGQLSPQILGTLSTVLRGGVLPAEVGGRE